MSKFMGIKEVAEYLGVEYKTVRKLIISGELPAGKIGGVYRIKKSDVDEYFERQKQKTLEISKKITKEDYQICGYCGKTIYSELSIGGHCQQCGLPLCTDCWDIEKLRYCKEHLQKPTSEKGPESQITTAQYCSRCGKQITPLRKLAGKCQEPSCENMLCQDCWQIVDDRFCKEHRMTKNKKLEQAQKALKEGKIKLIVTSYSAKQKELNFLGRFEQNFANLPVYINPFNNEKIAIKSIDKIRKSFDGTYKIKEMVKNDQEFEALRELIPLNIRIQYPILKAQKKLVAKGNKGIVVEAFSYSHIDSYMKNGFDINPATNSELLTLINNYLKKAEEEDNLYIVGIASTTGWDQEAIQLISHKDISQRFSHPMLSICLVDLENYTLYYNKFDNKLHPYIQCFTLEVESEAIARVKQFVKDYLAEKDYISLSVIKEKLRLSEQLISQALKELEQEADYILEEIKDVGLVLSLKR